MSNLYFISVLIASFQLRGFWSSGGLGDVPISLAKELFTCGHKPHLIMPFFKEVTPQIKKKKELFEMQISLGNSQFQVKIFQTTLNPDCEIPVYLICCREIFDEGTKDCPQKAIFFARCVVAFMKKMDCFHLVHCNDWHCGSLPAYLKISCKKDPVLKKVASVYTTHNFHNKSYQGSFCENNPSYRESLLDLAGFGKDLFAPMKTLSAEHHKNFNFTKLGTAFADIAYTVSKNYAKEALIPKFSGGIEGLHDFFRETGLHGCLNGIDTEEFNPKTDEALTPYHFSAEDPIEKIKFQKKNIRHYNLRNYWINDKKPLQGIQSDSFLVSVISRIDVQKMPVFFYAIDQLLTFKNVQFIVLGTAHPTDFEYGKFYEKKFLELTNCNFFFLNLYDEKLSRLIYAATDLFLSAPTFEPCGLTHMYAHRYASIPFVRKVNGLHDFIIDEPHPEANAFSFIEELSNKEVINVQNAVTLLIQKFSDIHNIFHNEPNRWNNLVTNGLRRDSSWKKTTQAVLKLYFAAIEKNKKG